MRVAIDVSPLKSEDKIRGIGSYTRCLIKELEKIDKVDKSFQLDSFEFGKDFDKLDNYDVVHYPLFNPFQQDVPLKRNVKSVITIHDVIALIYPKHYPLGVRGRIRLLKHKQLLRSVNAVITDSVTSKKDIVRLLGVPSEKIFPIYLAAADEYKKIREKKLLEEVKRKFNLPEKFVLYVGDINHNKNIITLVKACEIAKVPLVIVGKHALDLEQQGVDIAHIEGPKDWIRFLLGVPHPELAHYREIYERFEASKNTVRTGFVRQTELVAIYNLASIYCQPSLYEGFGLPVLEAFACGIPVVISKTNALVEVANGAALIVDTKDAGDFARKFRKIIKDKKLQRDLIERGCQRVKEFSWEKTARKTIEVYKNVLLGVGEV